MPNEKKYISSDYLLNILCDEDRYDYLSADDVLDAPTANVSEVKHGEWIDKQPYTYSFDNITFNGTGEQCNLCGWINKGGIDKYTSYCPNCGAKMSVKSELKKEGEDKIKDTSLLGVLRSNGDLNDVKQ